MPEKFRANDSESGGFWFWKKSSAQNKHKRNALNPAKDIISQANDVVNKYLMESEPDTHHKYRENMQKVHGILFLGFSTIILGVLVYYLIH